MSTATLPGWLKPANTLVKFLHRLGLPLGTIHVLTHPWSLLRAAPVDPGLTVDLSGQALGHLGPRAVGVVEERSRSGTWNNSVAVAITSRSTCLR